MTEIVSGTCDFCSNDDDQLTRTGTGFLICPACATPEAPSEDCDRCGEPVDLTADDNVMLFAPPSFHDVLLGFRHAKCSGIFDCENCGDPVDVKNDDYGTTSALVRDVPIVRAVFHERCNPYPNG